MCLNIFCVVHTDFMFREMNYESLQKKGGTITVEAYMFCGDEKKTIRQLKLSAEQRPQKPPPPLPVKRPLKSVHLLLMLNHEYVMKLPQ